MWKFALLVSLFAAFAQAYVEHDNFFADNSEQKKIQTTLNIEGKIACAGAIVAAGTGKEESKPTIITTAAHCVYKKPVWAVQVNTAEGTKPVSNIFIHPYYNPPSRDYDVAIIKVQLSKTLVSLNLIEESPKAGNNVTLLDKKGTEKNGIVMDRTICKNKLTGKIRVTSKMVCVQLTDNKEFFDGSPVFHTIGDRSTLAGIISYRSPEMPTVYTNFANSEISAFINRYK